MATARELHGSAIVIDGHNDSMVLRLSRGQTMDLAVPVDRTQVDLPRLQEGGVTAMFSYCGSQDLAAAMQLLDATHQLAEDHPGDFILVDRAADVTTAGAAGRVGLVPQLESLSCCMGNAGVLRALYRLGVRVGNLTHGEAPEHGCQGEPSLFDYCTPADRERMRREMKGLTDFGREAVREMNRMGMVVDMAHINDAAFYEVLQLTQAPPVFSHGGVFSLCPHSRGLTDDQIRALAEAGGVHGVACYPRFIHRERPTLQALVDQVEHSINLVGPDHVGIGADYDGMGDDTVAIPEDVGRLGEITAQMVGRGWDDETVRKVLGGNFLRVLETVCG